MQTWHCTNCNLHGIQSGLGKFRHRFSCLMPGGMFAKFVSEWGTNASEVKEGRCEYCGKEYPEEWGYKEMGEHFKKCSKLPEMKQDGKKG